MIEELESFANRYVENDSGETGSTRRFTSGLMNHFGN